MKNTLIKKGLLSSALTVISLGMVSAAEQWNPSQSMTPALEETINIHYVNPMQELIGKDGPSPSNQALVVFLTNKGPYVLMCKDYDLRKDGQGNFRPTYGALKASFGFGLPQNHHFQNSFEAIIQGPANIAAYGLFTSIAPEFQFALPNTVYSEGGAGWGPAVTIPVVMTAANGGLINEEEMGYILQSLNAKANEVFANKKADDIMTGRFRDFTAIPLSTLLPTGSDQPAVYDASKLQTITLADNTIAKLWDENQMRKNLLPHVEAFINNLLPQIPTK